MSRNPKAPTSHPDFQRQPEVKPLVWVIASYRAGENSQVFGLAERLGLPWQRIDLQYRRNASLISLCRLVSSSGIANLNGLSLQPPWPDLIISSGMKNEPFCRWIKKQNNGHTRLVFLGRTWAPVQAFSLLITTPQYRVPPAANVIENHVTLHGVQTAALASARIRFASLFQGRPDPRIAVLVGGSSGPYFFGPDTARHLATQLKALKQSTGGSIMVSTSSRTPIAAASALRSALSDEDQFYLWNPKDANNPYMGMMAWADQIVVTSDSVAMMSEAAATGKSVFVYDLAAAQNQRKDIKSRLYQWLMTIGPTRVTRDLACFHQAFINQGFGAWLGSAANRPSVSPEAELQQTAQVVLKLLDTARQDEKL